MFEVDSLDRIIEASMSQPNVHDVIKTAGCKSRPEPHDEFCLQFAETVARRYLSGKLSFRQADHAVNWLFAHSYVTEDCPGEMPDLARKVFEAFDDGEHHHEGDSKEVDPEIKYTIPQLRDIIGVFDRLSR